MKKTNLLLLTLCVVLFAGCSESNDEINTPAAPEMVHFSVEASQDVAGDSESRAFLDGLIARWKELDKIALFAKRTYAANKTQQQLLEASTVKDDGKAATFEGEIVKPEEPDTYVAAYPAETTTITDSNITFTIPATQNGSADPMMAAQTETDVHMSEASLTFKPVNAFLHVSLTGTASEITELVFEACDKEDVAGNYVYNLDGTTSVSGGKSITVTTDADDFYITVPAVTLAKGYKITYSNAAGEKMIRSYGYNSGKTFAVGTVYPLAVSEFTAVKVTLGEVKSSYKNPDDGLANGTIFTSGNTVTGASATLVSETGIQYNIKGNSQPYLVAAEGKPMSFDLNVALNSELYEVVAYAKIDGVTYTSAKQVVGVLGTNPMVKVSATSSYDTDGVVSKNNNFDLGGNGFHMTAALQGIASSLVASTSFSYSGGRSATVDGSLNGTTFTADVTGLAYNEWANYSVTGIATLGNGRSFSDNGSAVVTGIPYNVDFAANNSPAGWTLSGTSGGSYLYLSKDGSDGKAFSPQYNVPANVDIAYSVGVRYYVASTSTSGRSASFYIGTTSSNSAVASSYNTYTAPANNNTSASSYGTTTGNLTLTTTNRYISLYHNKPNLTGLWGINIIDNLGVINYAITYR